MSQKVPSIADKRFEEGLVPGRRSRPRALDQERRGEDDEQPWARCPRIAAEEKGHEPAGAAGEGRRPV